MSRKRNIPRRKKSKKNVRSSAKPILSERNFNFDFRDNRWLTTVKFGKFTNKLKDVNSYAGFITEILGKIIPEVQDKSDDIVKRRVRGFHCHPIEQDDSAYRTVTKAIRMIYGESFERSISKDEHIYQLGVDGGLRIVTLRNKRTNVIRPLFVDYHHLAYPNVKYSHTDYIKKSFCPKTSYL